MQHWLKNFVVGELHSNLSADRLGYVWLDLVSEFSALQLTRETDRLPALSGLACEFSDKALGSYVAGIWEHDLARGLLFETIASKENRSANLNHQAAPSWSWASAQVAQRNRISYSYVLYYRFVQDSNFSVTIMDLLSNTSNIFSWVSNGLLELRGACTTAIIVTEASPEEPESRKLLLKAGGIQRSIPLDQFISDDHTQHLENTQLHCILVGSACGARINSVEVKTFEYVLMLQKVPGEQRTYKRIGILFSGHNDTWSLRNEPVLTIVLA